MGRGRQSIAVCFPQVPFMTGGAELHVQSLCAELRQRGFSVELVTVPFCWDKPHLLQNALAWRLTHLNADVVIGTKFPSYYVKHPNKIVWLFHQHRAAYDLYGTDYSDFGREPGDEEIRAAVHEGDTRMIAEARKLFSVSRNVSRRLARYNGIVAEPLYHPSPFYRQLYFQEYGDFVFLPTRLELNKRPGLLIDAMRRTRSGVSCVIAGTGSLETALHREVERAGLGDRVRFVGWISDPAELCALYARCRAVFYGPYDEDYGYVTLEAFASHKPMLTTSDAGGVLEFVSDDETGYVTEADADAIADRIDRLAESPRLCARLGDAGHDRVAEISWDHVIRQLIN